MGSGGGPPRSSSPSGSRTSERRSSRWKRPRARAGRRRRREAAREAPDPRAPRPRRRRRRGRRGRRSARETRGKARATRLDRGGEWRSMPSRVRLADLLAGLSIAIDLGFGLRPESAMRSCLAATRLARAHGLGESDVRDSFFASLLLHVGCPGFSHETAALFGNEFAVTRAASRTNLADPADYESTLIPEATRGLAPGPPVVSRTHWPLQARRSASATTRRAARSSRSVARRIGLGQDVERALYEVAEWWNGGGAPQGFREDGSRSRPGRSRRRGRGRARRPRRRRDSLSTALRRRAGSILDPNLVETFAANAFELLRRARATRASLLEPSRARRGARADRAPDVAAVFGDVADLKFPALHGHSSRSRGSARGAAAVCGSTTKPAPTSRCGVTSTTSAASPCRTRSGRSPGPLTSARVGAGADALVPLRAHPRDLGTLDALAPLAGMHHERLDGSGYHRACGARDQPVARARARGGRRVPGDDAGSTAPRAAHRRAGRRRARARGRAGRLDGEAPPPCSRPRVRHDRARTTCARRASASARSRCSGSSPPASRTPRSPSKLVISRRTAEHHVQHIYAKLGVRSRPAVALFAMEHGLVTSPRRIGRPADAAAQSSSMLRAWAWTKRPSSVRPGR